MSIFRRRTETANSPEPTDPSPAVPQTGHAGDDQLLRQLAARSDLNQPRHWVHYLYFPDEQQARAAAGDIEYAGWTLTKVGPDPGDGTDWVVIAERHTATTPQAVKEARQFFERTAHTHGAGEYDGWEASL